MEWFLKAVTAQSVRAELLHETTCLLCHFIERAGNF